MRGQALRAAVLLFLGVGAIASSRADPFDDLEPGGLARAAAAADGATLHLEDGRDIRLVGIEPPPPLPGSNGPRTLSARATAMLTGLVRGRDVSFGFAGPHQDRYGRLWAQVRRVDDRLWLQGAMLERGLARVVPMPASRELLPDMLAAEATARLSRRGIWATDAFAVRHPDALRTASGEFLIVEGTVVEAVERKTILALVLKSSAEAPDPLGDTAGRGTDALEVLLPRAVRAEFTALGIDPLLATGWEVRARGWLERRNGVAQLTLAQREQLEFLSAKPP